MAARKMIGKISPTYHPEEWIYTPETRPDGTKAFHFDNGTTVITPPLPEDPVWREGISKRMSAVNHQIFERADRERKQGI